MVQRMQTPKKRQSQKRPRRWEEPVHDLKLIVEVLRHWDLIALVAGLLISTPWVRVSVVALAGASVLCTAMIRFANKRKSASLISLDINRPMPPKAGNWAPASRSV
jgi:hypothetical protein